MNAKLDNWRAATADLMLSCAAADVDQAAELVTVLEGLLRSAPRAAALPPPHRHCSRLPQFAMPMLRP